ncbi:ribosomal RNA small subunit methyltransferase A [bacterium]|nr:ribosomal RNA small subunit methyltransferase A [bacterium]PJA73715.1 MAG: ribosomal RNA small subunit methyltransferase A [bacterium CG_4_9_14_3_um_filter_65_15]
MSDRPESQSELLRRYGIRPVKRRGQNFLVDGNLARAIAQDVLAVGDEVLELGAGAGALTGPLLAAGARRVLCVEVDRHLCALLRAEFGSQAAFDLQEDDLGKLDWPALVERAGSRPVVAGNLPYVLTSTVLFAIADLRDRIAGGVFMVQKEVAGRLTAAPGSRDYGVLSVVLGSIFAITHLRNVPPEVFWPRPEVASAMVKLIPEAPWEPDEFTTFSGVVRRAFEQRRKKLGSVLRRRFGYDAPGVDKVARTADIDPDLRPEQLDRSQWRRLAAAITADRDQGTPQGD